MMSAMMLWTEQWCALQWLDNLNLGLRPKLSGLVSVFGLRLWSLVMLVVPSTRRSTLGDRAFPVASARAWNSLPSSVRNAPSLTTFRREPKTVLFRSSFDNDWAIVIVLHSITVVCPRLLTVGDSVVWFFFSFFLFNFIRCPCNVFDVIVSP